MKTKVRGQWFKNGVQIAKRKSPNQRLNRLETRARARSSSRKNRGSRGIQRYGFEIRPIFCIVKIFFAKKFSAKKIVGAIQNFQCKKCQRNFFFLEKTKKNA